MTGIAICGLGNIGAVHLANLLSLRGCKVTGVYDSSESVMDRIQKTFGVRRFSSFEDLLRDTHTDAVVIATPTQTHRALALAALERGKHVFLEKPLAGTEKDARAILEAAADSRLKVQLGFCERFNPQYIEARRHVGQGELGKIRAIYSSRVSPLSLGDPTWELGIFDTAVHNVDLILWLINELPEWISASAVRLYPDSDVPHSAVMTLRFSSGALATDHITWLRDEQHPLHQCARSRMQILGECGAYEIDLTTRPSALLNQQGYSMPDTVILANTEYFGCLKLQFDAFLRSIEEGAPIMAPAEDAWNAERVVLAARQSLEKGAEISLR